MVDRSTDQAKLNFDLFFTTISTSKNGNAFFSARAEKHWREQCGVDSYQQLLLLYSLIHCFNCSVFNFWLG